MFDCTSPSFNDLSDEKPCANKNDIIKARNEIEKEIYGCVEQNLNTTECDYARYYGEKYYYKTPNGNFKIEVIPKIGYHITVTSNWDTIGTRQFTGLLGNTSSGIRTANFGEYIEPLDIEEGLYEIGMNITGVTYNTTAYTYGGIAYGYYDGDIFAIKGVDYKSVVTDKNVPPIQIDSDAMCFSAVTYLKDLSPLSADFVFYNYTVSIGTINNNNMTINSGSTFWILKV